MGHEVEAVSLGISPPTPSPSLSFLTSWDNNYLMDRNKRTRVEGFCNFQVLFNHSDLAHEASLTLSNPRAPAALSAVTSGPQTCHRYYGLTWTIPAAGWWTAEPQLQGEGQLQPLSQKCKQEASRAQPLLAEQGTEGKCLKIADDMGEGS